MGSVSSASVLQTTSAPAVNRPNAIAVGTIVWLGSEVMFFAGLFAIYFTLKTSQPGLWAEKTAHLDVPYALTNTIILVSSSFSCQFGVFAA
jgi:cytochrome c oxidase subunit 3